MQQSGIGTGIQDGLTWNPYAYGLRVQDKEISLNVADGHRVLGVFESNNTDEPSLPTITSTNASDVFDNDNVIVGEQFIGNISGAIGRVVRIVTASQFEFVYENDEVGVHHSFVTFNDGNVEAVMAVYRYKDGKIISLETGATPMSK